MYFVTLLLKQREQNLKGSIDDYNMKRGTIALRTICVGGKGDLEFYLDYIGISLLLQSSSSIYTGSPLVQSCPMSVPT